jgi:diguanylate cyclase (GGDEF)-like protein
MPSAPAPDAKEREYAGKLAGCLWLTATPMVVALLLLPGGDTSDWELATGASVPGLLWGTACLLVIPWDRVTSLLPFHLPAALCLPYIGALTWLTGGASSPFAFTLLILVAYCCYFFTPEQAVLYVFAALGVAAAPLIYDPGAVEAGLPGQLAIGVPTLASVAGIIVLGKRQLVSLREEAEYASLHDSLTGLANRRALAERLEEHAVGQRESDRFALLLVDLDEFKDANTLYGHPGGDAALRVTATALRSATRERDMVARLGGDEFAVLVPGAGNVELRAIARRVLRVIQQAGAALELPGFELTACAGWARFPDDAGSLDELLAAADLSLRGAKSQGRGSYQSPSDWAPEAA